MSGMAGVIRLDGAPVAPEAIERMAAATAHRGPDVQHIWRHGSAALAHAMLYTTTESHVEVQPFVEAGGAVAIVADVRLDNRAELLPLLGARKESGDAELLLAAYRKWGEACPAHLEGDFAFALWDAKERTLFCARDAFGVKPLLYSLVPGKLFAFGSEARALLALDEVPRELDDARIADFLALHFDQPERTFYRAIRRMPAGASLTLRNSTVATSRYWSPEHVRPLRLRGPRRNEEYAAGYREHFLRAVRERMRVSDPAQIGAMLSGGLDSTSIACAARDELRAARAAPLPVFSWIFSDSMEADERQYQESALAEGGMRAVTLDSSRLDATPWTDLEALLPDGPVYAANHYLNHVAARQARQLGVRVLLDGTGGDSTISRGRARFVELFFGGRFFTLADQLRALADRRGTRESLPRLFLANVAAPLMPPSVLALALRLRGRTPSGHSGLALLSPRLARLTGARRPPNVWALTARQDHLAQLTAPLLADGLELLDRAMAVGGVEGRYPFFDRRLAEYCVSLPADQKLDDGYSRIVARRALEGILPEAVRWRAGKGLPGLHVIAAMRQQRAVLDDLFVRDPSALAPYVDMKVLRAAYADLLANRPVDFRTAIRVWSAAVLGQWLRNVLSA
jgi:asparagine synthase (glutamine-hydrolysing)